jgi:SNF2 family DNA or RNA helicase
MYLPFLNIGLEQVKDKIFITNVPARAMERDIKRLYKSVRITNNMFCHLAGSRFSIYSFFALELYYILDELVNNRKFNTNVKVLNQIKRLLKEKTWLKNIDANVPDRLNFKKLNELTYTPLPFQMEFLKKYSKVHYRYGLNGMLLAGTAGSGKTFTTLALAHCLETERVVIVCPLNAVDKVWVDNIQKVFKQMQSYWTYSSGKQYNGERFAIFHYEALDKALLMIPELKRRNVVVVIDESHNLNEIKSLRTQRYIELCKQLESRDIIPASGTSIKALTSEIIPVIQAIDPLFTDEVMEKFKAMYKGDVDKAVDVLANRIDVFSFKITKSELKLSEPIFHELKIEMPNGNDYTLASIAVVMAAFIKERIEYYNKRKPDDTKFFYECLDIALKAELGKQTTDREKINVERQFDDYRATLKEIIQANEKGNLRAVSSLLIQCTRFEKSTITPNLPTKEMRDRFIDVKSVVKYVKLKIQGECLGRVLGRMRIDAHIDMVKHIDYSAILDSTTKKTVAFTSFVEVITACNEKLLELKYKPLMVHGQISTPIAQVVDKFGNDAEANPLVATYASLSTAVPLIMADTMLIINYPFRNYILEQAISRIHRLGQTEQTVVYSTVLDTGEQPNISSRNVDILKWSQEQVEKILKIESPFKVGDSDADVINAAMEAYDDGYMSEFRQEQPSGITLAGEIESVSMEEMLQRPKTPLYLKW